MRSSLAPVCPPAKRSYFPDFSNTASTATYAAETSDPYDLGDNGMQFVNWNVTDVQTVFR